MPRATPAVRRAWILNYLRARVEAAGRAYWVNVLDRAFVDAYVEACVPKKVDVMPYGADKVPQLGRDLTELFQTKQLQRRRTGIQGTAGMGFPRWVWEYTL